MRFRVVRMAAREAANGKASHPIFVDFSKKPTEKTWRDARRRHFSEVCLNDIRACFALCFFTNLKLIMVLS